MIRQETKSKIFFSVLVLFYLIVSIGASFLPESMRNYEVSIMLGQSIVAVPTILFFIVTKGKALKEISFKRIRISNILILILLTYLFVPVITFINSLSLLFTDNKVNVMLSETSRNGFWLNLLMVAVTPAIFEELAFRGIIYHGIKKQSMLAGMIMSALAFGLFHMNLNQFSYAVVMGILMILVVEATGSIFASMIVHFIINGNSVILMEIQNAISSSDIVKESAAQVETIDPATMRLSIIVAIVFWGVIAVGTGTLAFFVYRWLCRRCNTTEHVKSIFTLRKKNNNQEENVWDMQRLAGNIMFGLGILLCIIVIVLNQMV